MIVCTVLVRLLLLLSRPAHTLCCLRLAAPAIFRTTTKRLCRRHKPTLSLWSFGGASSSLLRAKINLFSPPVVVTAIIHCFVSSAVSVHFVCFAESLSMWCSEKVCCWLCSRCSRTPSGGWKPLSLPPHPCRLAGENLGADHPWPYHALRYPCSVWFGLGGAGGGVQRCWTGGGRVVLLYFSGLLTRFMPCDYLGAKEHKSKECWGAEGGGGETAGVRTSCFCDCPWRG